MYILVMGVFICDTIYRDISILSPFLFTTFINYLLLSLQIDSDGVSTSYLNCNSSPCADDVTVLKQRQHAKAYKSVLQLQYEIGF